MNINITINGNGIPPVAPCAAYVVGGLVWIIVTSQVRTVPSAGSKRFAWSQTERNASCEMSAVALGSVTMRAPDARQALWCRWKKGFDGGVIAGRDQPQQLDVTAIGSGASGAVVARR
ncbi:hypothetical protein GCM10009765_22080 [Fodinicola feengrottensis]|uniref:Uncharacterized protein n=1 Tax=Fodinicola feengrottensis TaxID=435914 RepID=A0ABP4SNC1_9ACTN